MKQILIVKYYLLPIESNEIDKKYKELEKKFEDYEKSKINIKNIINKK